jgi:hypothetical protein
MKVKIDKEFESLLVPLRPEELQLLEQSLYDQGCRDALKVWASPHGDLLLDGHNRYRWCLKNDVSAYGISPVSGINNREEARLWVLENQLGRRNLTDDQRAVYGKKVLEQRVALSNKQRAKTAGRSNRKVTNLGVKMTPELDETKSLALYRATY